MISDMLTRYLPLTIVFSWIIYKWWSSYKVTKMLPLLQENGAVFIDVRSVSEFNNAHADVCKNIPYNEIKDNLPEIPKDLPIVLCCSTGTRSSIAKFSLLKHGYSNIHNIGKWTLLRGVPSGS